MTSSNTKQDGGDVERRLDNWLEEMVNWLEEMDNWLEEMQEADMLEKKTTTEKCHAKPNKSLSNSPVPLLFLTFAGSL